jgi:hypothetical protein
MRKVFHLAVAFLSGALVWHFFLMSLQVLASRNGTVGGEILFLPLMALLFYLGWAVKDEINELRRIEKNQGGGIDVR